MKLFIKLAESYPAKQTDLGEQVRDDKGKRRRIVVFKDRWTEIPFKTRQILRLEKKGYFVFSDVGDVPEPEETGIEVKKATVKRKGNKK